MWKEERLKPRKVSHPLGHENVDGQFAFHAAAPLLISGREQLMKLALLA